MMTALLRDTVTRQFLENREELKEKSKATSNGYVQRLTLVKAYRDARSYNRRLLERQEKSVRPLDVEVKKEQQKFQPTLFAVKQRNLCIRVF